MSAAPGAELENEGGTQGPLYANEGVGYANEVKLTRGPMQISSRTREERAASYRPSR